MKRNRLIGFCTASLAVAATVHASTDVLTYSGIVVADGAIDGVSLAGQIATVEIEFQSGLLASEETFRLGTLISARYEFSDAGSFVIDTPQDSLEFGNVNGFDLSFFDPTLDLRMLSGASAGDQPGFDPRDGENLREFFLRWGDGRSIDFISSSRFQMLNRSIGGLNSGTSAVTANIVGAGQSDVTLTYVPTPASSVVICGGAALVSRRRR